MTSALTPAPAGLLRREVAGAPTPRTAPASLGFIRSSSRPGSGSILRLTGVEGWRGLAALVVVFFHVWQNMDTNGDGLGPFTDHTRFLTTMSNLDGAVDLFFVLSGLLLFLPFAQAALDDEVAVPSRRTFFYRRLLRLYPLYVAVVVASWFPRNYGVKTADWTDLTEHVLMVQSFDSHRIFHTIGPAWTLSVEWIFYCGLAFLGPALVRWVRREEFVIDRAWRLYWVFAVLAVAGVLYKANVEMVWRIPATDWAWRFGPAAKADNFAIGMAMAVTIVLLKGRKLPSWTFPVFAGAGAAMLYSFRLPGSGDAPTWLLIGRHPLFAIAWATLLFGFITCRSPWPARIIDNRLLVRVGILTFAIYLIHEPVILALAGIGAFSKDPSVAALVLDLVLVVGCTLLLSWAGHRLVEEPWTDAAALQSPGGGRRDLYPGLHPTTGTAALPEIVPGVHTAPTLRSVVMARASGAVHP